MPEPVTAAAVPRRSIRIAVLAGLTLTLLVLSIWLALPFLPAFAWAMALAIVGQPLHQRILDRWPQRETVAAILTVVLIGSVLVAPLVFVANSTYSEAGKFVTYLEKSDWRDNQLVRRLGRHIDVEREARNLIQSIRNSATPLLKSTLWSVTQAVITLFFLFFFFRDREGILVMLRSLLPLSRDELDHFFERIGNTVRATVSGTLIVAGIQGALGGLMFWFLGLPAPGLWGFIMMVMSVIPTLGAFVVWAPAAAYLAVQGDWTKAAILTGWGVAVVSTIDNLLYPMLVGRDVRLHTLPVFVSLVGGIMIFGASGLVLGPVILMSTLALLEIWYHRAVVAEATSAVPERVPEEPVPAPPLPR